VGPEVEDGFGMRGVGRAGRMNTVAEKAEAEAL